MSSFSRFAGAALLGAWLAGCGFHLQGREPLSQNLRRVQVVAADRQSDFTAALTGFLRTAGAQLQSDADSADTVVRISRDELTQQVLAVSSNNLPREYELTYHVRLSARAGDRVLLEEQEFELSRHFTFDEREVLAKEHEREQLRADLARDLAATVVRRLRAL